MGLQRIRIATQLCLYINHDLSPRDPFATSSTPSSHEYRPSNAPPQAPPPPRHNSSHKRAPATQQTAAAQISPATPESAPVRQSAAPPLRVPAGTPAGSAVSSESAQPDTRTPPDCSSPTTEIDAPRPTPTPPKRHHRRHRHLDRPETPATIAAEPQQPTPQKR